MSSRNPKLSSMAGLDEKEKCLGMLRLVQNLTGRQTSEFPKPQEQLSWGGQGGCGGEVMRLEARLGHPIRSGGPDGGREAN